MGDARLLTLGYRTTLRRTGASVILLRHHEADIIAYRADGSVGVSMQGYHTRTTVQRVRCVLPPGWVLRTDPSRRPHLGRRPLEFVYDDVWRTSWQDGTVFYSNGDVRLPREGLYTREMLDGYVADQIAERGYEDAAHRRIWAITRNVRRREAERARQQPPSLSFPSPQPVLPMCSRPGCVLRTHSLAAPHVYLDPCPQCADMAHDGQTCPACGTCTTPACHCDGAYTHPQSVHGRWACFEPRSDAEEAAAYERAQSWLRPAIQQYMAAHDTIHVRLTSSDQEV
jgi:hypothetical protein